MSALWLAFLIGLAGCSRSSSNQSLPNANLSTLSGDFSQNLSSCPTAKCLTVVVAPWCPYCRAATPAIIELRDYLAKHKIATTRVVVGMDKPQALADYAKDFGPETLLDPSEALEVKGVPHFFVSNSSGKVLKDVPGMPQIDDVKDLANYFELIP